MRSNMENHRRVTLCHFIRWTDDGRSLLFIGIQGDVNYDVLAPALQQ